MSTIECIFKNKTLISSELPRVGVLGQSSGLRVFPRRNHLDGDKNYCEAIYTLSSYRNTDSELGIKKQENEEAEDALLAFPHLLDHLFWPECLGCRGIGWI